MRVISLILGLILLATGFGKLLDVPGFETVIRSYHATLPWMEKPIAVTMILIELKLAELFLRNHRVGQAARISIVLHSAFIGWAVLALVRGIHVPNCGCFGVFLARPLTWMTPVEDLVMIALSALLARGQKKSRGSSVAEDASGSPHLVKNAS